MKPSEDLNKIEDDKLFSSLGHTGVTNPPTLT